MLDTKINASTFSFLQINQTNYTQCVNTYHCYYYCTCTGGSSGAALSVVLKAAKNLKAGQRCLPDSIRKHLIVTIYVHDCPYFLCYMH